MMYRSWGYPLIQRSKPVRPRKTIQIRDWQKAAEARGWSQEKGEIRHPRSDRTHYAWRQCCIAEKIDVPWESVDVTPHSDKSAAQPVQKKGLWYWISKIFPAR